MSDPLKKLRQKRMDQENKTTMQELKALMRQGAHLTETETVNTMLKKANARWSTYTDVEREFIKLATKATEEQTPWKL